MDKSIGVGSIVGLTFASSLYVWNNVNFTKAMNKKERRLALYSLLSSKVKNQ